MGDNAPRMRAFEYAAAANGDEVKWFDEKTAERRTVFSTALKTAIHDVFGNRLFNTIVNITYASFIGWWFTPIILHDLGVAGGHLFGGDIMDATLEFAPFLGKKALLYVEHKVDHAEFEGAVDAFKIAFSAYVFRTCLPLNRPEVELRMFNMLVQAKRDTHRMAYVASWAKGVEGAAKVGGYIPFLNGSQNVLPLGAFVIMVSACNDDLTFIDILTHLNDAINKKPPQTRRLLGKLFNYDDTDDAIGAILDIVTKNNAAIVKRQLAMDREISDLMKTQMGLGRFGKLMNWAKTLGFNIVSTLMATLSFRVACAFKTTVYNVAELFPTPAFMSLGIDGLMQRVSIMSILLQQLLEKRTGPLNPGLEALSLICQEFNLIMVLSGRVPLSSAMCGLTAFSPEIKVVDQANVALSDRLYGVRGVRAKLDIETAEYERTFSARLGKWFGKGTPADMAPAAQIDALIKGIEAGHFGMAAYIKDHCPADSSFDMEEFLTEPQMLRDDQEIKPALRSVELIKRAYHCIGRVMYTEKYNADHPYRAAGGASDEKRAEEKRADDLRDLMQTYLVECATKTNDPNVIGAPAYKRIARQAGAALKSGFDKLQSANDAVFRGVDAVIMSPIDGVCAVNSWLHTLVDTAATQDAPAALPPPLMQSRSLKQKQALLMQKTYAKNDHGLVIDKTSTDILLSTNPGTVTVDTCASAVGDGAEGGQLTVESLNACISTVFMDIGRAPISLIPPPRSLRAAGMIGGNASAQRSALLLLRAQQALRNARQVARDRDRYPMTYVVFKRKPDADLHKEIEANVKYVFKNNYVPGGFFTASVVAYTNAIVLDDHVFSEFVVLAIDIKPRDDDSAEMHFRTLDGQIAFDAAVAAYKKSALANADLLPVPLRAALHHPSIAPITSPLHTLDPALAEVTAALPMDDARLRLIDARRYLIDVVFRTLRTAIASNSDTDDAAIASYTAALRETPTPYDDPVHAILLVAFKAALAAARNIDRNVGRAAALERNAKNGVNGFCSDYEGQNARMAARVTHANMHASNVLLKLGDYLSERDVAGAPIDAKNALQVAGESVVRGIRSIVVDRKFRKGFSSTSGRMTKMDDGTRRNVLHAMHTVFATELDGDLLDVQSTMQLFERMKLPPPVVTAGTPVRLLQMPSSPPAASANTAFAKTVSVVLMPAREDSHNPEYYKVVLTNECTCTLRFDDTTVHCWVEILADSVPDHRIIVMRVNTRNTTSWMAASANMSDTYYRHSDTDELRLETLWWQTPATQVRMWPEDPAAQGTYAKLAPRM